MVGHVALASAASLQSVDRTMAREPSYQTQAPKYCLAVFGEGAQTRVWLVLDGNTLFVDRNGNSDLTEAGERLEGNPVANSPGEGSFNAVAISVKEGVPPQAGLEVRVHPSLTFVYCHSEGRPWQRAVVDSQGYLMFGKDPEHAPVLHFNGPVAVGLRFAHKFTRHGQVEDLDVFVGSPGIGVGSFVRFGHEPTPAFAG